MTPADQMEHLHAARWLYCWWCDGEIAPTEPLATDGLGRPLHAGGCAELSAEYDRDEDDSRLADLVEQKGTQVGDEYHAGASVATVYTGIEPVIGCAAAVVWRRKDGAVDITRHSSAAHALIGLVGGRRGISDNG